jgi:hypothetical protein
MDARTRQTPIALFAALTRAVREEAMPDDTRAQAYEELDAMAANIGLSTFAAQRDRFVALARDSAELNAAVRHFEPALAALACAACPDIAHARVL